MFKPDSDWQPPAELPDLRGRPVVALDCETKDQGLMDKKGSGWALLRSGTICGVSWAAAGSSGYAPMAHPDTAEPLNVIEWVSDLVKSQQ